MQCQVFHPGDFQVPLPMAFPPYDAIIMAMGTGKAPANRQMMKRRSEVKKTILSFDDDVMLLFLEAILGQDMRILSAKDSAGGLALLRNQRVDWVVVDLDMKDCAALDFIRQAKTISPGSRFVVLSGTETVKIDWQSLHDLGIDSCLCKPMDPDDFLRMFAVEEARSEAGRPIGTNSWV